MSRRKVIVLLGAVLCWAPRTDVCGQSSQSGYPAFPKPDVAISVTGGRGHLSSAAAGSYQLTFASSESFDGPWNSVSEDFDVTGSQRFFRAVINQGFVRFEGNFSRVDLLALRVANDPGEIVTQSSFRLTIEATNWFDGISVYRIASGPSTGDVNSDYAKLFGELLVDPKIGFVAAVDIATTGGPPGVAGQTCYMFATDELFLRSRTPDYSDEELAALDLSLIRRGGYTYVRWTKPKSMRPAEFLEKLKAAGVDGDFEALGCAL